MHNQIFAFELMSQIIFWPDHNFFFYEIDNFYLFNAVINKELIQLCNAPHQHTHIQMQLIFLFMVRLKYIMYLRCSNTVEWMQNNSNKSHHLTKNDNTVETLYRVAPKNPEQSIFQDFALIKLSVFTLLDRASFPHYNNTRIIKFGWKLFILWVISCFAPFMTKCLILQIKCLGPKDLIIPSFHCNNDNNNNNNNN